MFDLGQSDLQLELQNTRFPVLLLHHVRFLDNLNFLK